MSDRYIHLRDQTVEGLLGRVNALCTIPVTDEGWRTGDKPRYTLITAFPSVQNGEFVAVLETP